jgi:hypothetical protein
VRKCKGRGQLEKIKREFEGKKKNSENFDEETG